MKREISSLVVTLNLKKKTHPHRKRENLIIFRLNLKNIKNNNFFFANSNNYKAQTHGH